MTEANLVRRGIALPTVGNPAAANHILKGYEVVTADGELLVGTLSGTNGLANYGGFPSITASNWNIGTPVGRFDNISSEYANNWSLITSVAGTTLTTYFATRVYATTGGTLPLAPCGQLQFNPFSKTCSLRDNFGNVNKFWAFTIMSTQFYSSYMTVTVLGSYMNSGIVAGTVTLTLQKSYSAVQTINIATSIK